VLRQHCEAVGRDYDQITEPGKIIDVLAVTKAELG
jgi:hypothetical protein